MSLPIINRRCNVNVACSGKRADWAVPREWEFTPIQFKPACRLVCCDDCRMELYRRQNEPVSPGNQLSFEDLGKALE